MNTVNLKTFKTHEELSNEIQRRAEIILSANRITSRKVDFMDAFFVGSQKGFITFKNNRRVTLARLKEGQWVIPEKHVAASARYLAWQEMREARFPALKEAMGHLERGHYTFVDNHDSNF